MIQEIECLGGPLDGDVVSIDFEGMDIEPGLVHGFEIKRDYGILGFLYGITEAHVTTGRYVYCPQHCLYEWEPDEAT